jgi:hypothetical protein
MYAGICHIFLVADDGAGLAGVAAGVLEVASVRRGPALGYGSVTLQVGLSPRELARVCSSIRNRHAT